MVPSDQFNKATWMLASIAVVVGALYLAKDLLVPLTLAVLLSFLLSPVCDWFERCWLPRIPAVLVTTFLGFAGLGLVAWLAVVQITQLAPKIPEYQANLQAKLQSATAYTAGALSKVTNAGQSIGQNLPESEEVQKLKGTRERPYAVRVISSPASHLEVFRGAFGTLLSGLAMVAIVVVLVVFFLIRRDDLRDRFIRLIGKSQVNVTIQMLEDAGTRVSRYLLMLLFINATYGIAAGIGLYFIGLPNAILWGILATMLRFIPYLGPCLAAAMPIGLAMAISTGWIAPLLAIGLFVVLELLSNNVMEPLLYGKTTGVSVVAVLVAAVFWTWLWGIVGLLLATPLTVCLLVIGKHVPQLSFLDILLGNEPVFAVARRVYQRLVAGDQEEAAELVEAACGDQPLVQVYDTMLISALALAETHRQRDELSEGRHKFILNSVREILQDQGERRPETPATERTESENEAEGDSAGAIEPHRTGLDVLCLPARTEADEIAGTMLAQLLDVPGCPVKAAPVASSPSELIDLVRQLKPRGVCISALPPAAVMHARTLCKRLRGRVPAGNLVVGLWHAQGDLNKVKDRIGCGAEAHVVTTLAEAQEQLRLILADEAELPLPPVVMKGSHSATCLAGSAGVE
ncbi:MAG: AI-2E family transporter [Planctomycetaceae bacterium]|nr:MAG: AI-2E family transporter [Planctomycetaceae bacterium]